VFVYLYFYFISKRTREKIMQITNMHIYLLYKHRKLEVEQKRLETQKKTQERNLAVIHDRYAESLMKAVRQYQQF
jgi:hypothetical protein